MRSHTGDASSQVRLSVASAILARMYLAYVDESGNTGRRLDPDHPIHWLGCVLVPEENALALAASLDRVVAAHLPDDPDRELHGYELFSRKKRWAGTSIETTKTIYRQAMATLAEHDCAVAHASVNKAELARRGAEPPAPHFAALTFLVEKIDTYLCTQADPLRQRALLVADETNEHDAFAISMVQSMQRGLGGVYPGRRVTRVVDTVHFVRSESNRGVQLADLVTFALARLARKRGNESPGDVALRGIVEEYLNPQLRTWRMTWPSTKAVRHDVADRAD